ncbi:MAG: MbnP family protein [Bacteroidota bacterium]
MLSLPVFGQETETVELQFLCVKNGRELHLDSGDEQNEGEAEITRLKFYITNIQLLNKGVAVHDFSQKAYLVDLEDESSLSVQESYPTELQFDEVRFSLGVDSVTNMAGVQGGDLDPMNGMYWTWQSGYINFKLEGTHPDSQERNNEFHFHIGGYQGPYAAIQEIVLPMNSSSNVQIVLDLDYLLSKVNWATQENIMSPGESAFVFSQRLAKSFYINPFIDE